MNDQKLTEQLWQRNESALAEVESRYSRLYMGMLRRVLHDEQDVQECANDVLSALWNSIPPNRPDSLEAYLCTLSRRIAIDRYRYNTRDKRSAPYTVMLSELEDVLPDPESMTETEDGRVIALLNQFVASLDPRTRVLFVRRYVRCETVEELARRFGMGENAVSSRLYRARNKLRKLLRKENVRI